MPTAESLKQSIERLLALSPRERWAALHAIQDPEERRQVTEGLLLTDGDPYGEALAQAMADNLNRNVVADLERRSRKPAA